MTSELPYLTSDLPGIGGALKQELVDFEVDEVPLFAPSGEGDFLYLYVEKEGLSAEQLTSHLARDLAIAHQEIGMAGMKDRHGRTRQWLSVPGRCETKLADFQHPRISILERTRHRHKLRTGQLKANRFRIVVRNVVGDAMERAARIVERIQTLGFPNYFGDQRFGRDGETLTLGFDLLRGRKKPSAIPRARRRFLLRLSLSAVQSELFNRALADRLREGLLHQARTGDVMLVTASGGPFVSDDPAVDQPRLDSGEIVVSGPMFGPKMKLPQGEIAERETRLLAGEDLSLEQFAEYSNLIPGTRRAYIIRPESLEFEPVAEGIRFSFTIPSGSYATVLLREIMKG